eukprot:jgi/Ulvmu1/3339/UM155_0022.1
MLGLRAAGYTGQAQANGHGMEWERLGTSAEAMLRWAPMTARLLLARERHMHAVPLESVSLELMHGEGQWQNERPAEEKVEYTAAVGSVLAALGRLTALTRLDLCVAPATVRPGPHGGHAGADREQSWAAAAVDVVGCCMHGGCAAEPARAESADGADIELAGRPQWLSERGGDAGGGGRGWGRHAGGGRTTSRCR